jgi:hypothetical protein
MEDIEDGKENNKRSYKEIERGRSNRVQGSYRLDIGIDEDQMEPKFGKYAQIHVNYSRSQ